MNTKGTTQVGPPVMGHDVPMTDAPRASEPSTDRAAYRAARREAVRRHHPDVGGDPAMLQRELAAIERRFAPGSGRSAAAGPVFVTSGGPFRQAWKGIRSVVRRLPSRRTYIDI